MQLFLAIILIIVALLAGGAIGIAVGINVRKNTAEKEIGSAEEEAKRIVADAIKTAEAKKKEYVLEGKDEVHRFRNESEKEISDRRKEVQRQERRIQQKEETLDRKLDNVEKKDERVNKKLKEADQKLEEIETLKKSQFEMLQSRQKATCFPSLKASSRTRNPSRSWSIRRSSRKKRTKKPATLFHLLFKDLPQSRSPRQPFRLCLSPMTR